ncbi:MAG TPA: NADH-quinone oxidoreductase subunit C [Candidatus Paceibacterota bacterium]|nr:NADH-quinone oxidoreductase subunit C [Verrucomicrobiota bacterium]HRY46566.1 NADH-quinone oxidoreductase subunit C [Candidatus Paceibacterota bacterium]HSA03439.1 NADH-quinone oxidoreductase subunit C [Candidatus Paceibacterota bacterium]
MTVECIAVESLLSRVRHLREAGYRLVQIGATRLPSQIEVTYSFDLEGELIHLRLVLASAEIIVPSISALYWCAFIYENEMHDLFGLQIDGMTIDFGGQFYQTAIQHPFGAPQASALPMSNSHPVVAAAAVKS